MSSTVRVIGKFPRCNIDGCPKVAAYDAKMRHGWAYLCERHWKQFRLHSTLGVGKGQKLTTETHQENVRLVAELPTCRIQGCDQKAEYDALLVGIGPDIWGLVCEKHYLNSRRFEELGTGKGIKLQEVK